MRYVCQDHTFLQVRELPSSEATSKGKKFKKIKKKTLKFKIMVYWNVKVFASEYKPPYLLGKEYVSRIKIEAQLKKKSDYLSDLGYNKDYPLQCQAYLIIYYLFLLKEHGKKALHCKKLKKGWKGITGPFIHEGEDE